MANELARRWADPRFEKDIDRLIAAHFQGEAAIVFGPKSAWNVKPTNQEGEVTVYNPEIGQYVSEVKQHMEEIAPS